MHDPFLHLQPPPQTSPALSPPAGNAMPSAAADTGKSFRISITVTVPSTSLHHCQALDLSVSTAEGELWNWGNFFLDLDTLLLLISGC